MKVALTADALNGLMHGLQYRMTEFVSGWELVQVKLAAASAISPSKVSFEQ